MQPTSFNLNQPKVEESKQPSFMASQPKPIAKPQPNLTKKNEEPSLSKMIDDEDFSEPVEPEQVKESFFYPLIDTDNLVLPATLIE
jgi:hypothetical protein